MTKQYKIKTLSINPSKTFWFKLDGIVKIERETPKAYLIREQIQPEPIPMFSNSTYWVPKSRIINLEVL